jgi:CheY-like chemotaxis protein
VYTAGQRAKELVQQILTFSRPHDHSREPVLLSGVIQDALKFLRASLPSTIEMRQHIAPETDTVLANANQLHQVLMNLCANAEYAMRETGGILEVGVDAVEIDAAVAASPPALPPGWYVRVRVRDTGAGIPVDVVDRVFEPFFTTKGIGEGTGMGLAIVHGIVTSHGGAMAVDSTLGEGTTFTLYLPQMAQDAAPPSAPPAPVVPQGKGRLLLVDDEEVLARLGQALLERLGYEVAAYSSSLAALEAFQAEPSRFDLIITDQTMPVMTGATLVAELRHIRPDIPIILCTGFSHLMNAEKAEALGVDAFVLKPGVTQDLAATIQQVLENRARQGR